MIIRRRPRQRRLVRTALKRQAVAEAENGRANRRLRDPPQHRLVGPKLERNVARDPQTDAPSSKGWTIVRAWDHEDPVDVAERVVSIIRSSGLPVVVDNA